MESRQNRYDAVIVANGHKELPYIPDVPGLREWSLADRDSVTHSKFYVDAKPYREKNVLVVGNYASGGALATQIGVVASTVHVSTTAESLPESKVEHIRYHRVVHKYDVATSCATFQGGDTVSNLDYIVFCTGYLYSLPFLEEFLPGIADGKFVKDLYRHIFYTRDPTLAFVGLDKFVSPFPYSESQGAVIASVFSGRIQLPYGRFLQSAYAAELFSRQYPKEFYNLSNIDYTYCNDLY